VSEVEGTARGGVDSSLGLKTWRGANHFLQNDGWLSTTANQWASRASKPSAAVLFVPG
jgi:hypothetical protein